MRAAAEKELRPTTELFLFRLALHDILTNHSLPAAQPTGPKDSDLDTLGLLGSNSSDIVQFSARWGDCGPTCRIATQCNGGS